jgi:hypothetical protein
VLCGKIKNYLDRVLHASVETFPRCVRACPRFGCSSVLSIGLKDVTINKREYSKPLLGRTPLNVGLVDNDATTRVNIPAFGNVELEYTRRDVRRTMRGKPHDFIFLEIATADITLDDLSFRY